MSDWIIIILVLLNFFQAFFWSYQCQKLINKIMSRNYAEYELVKNGPEEKMTAGIDPEDERINQDILNELNGLTRPA